MPDKLSNENEAVSSLFGNDLPVGSIISYAGPKNKLPANWLVCDGSLHDRTTFILNLNVKYQVLFDAIGTSWGGDGANIFALPDLRGLFLRGVSEESDADADKLTRHASRSDLNNSGNKENAVGSKQKDAFQGHWHSFSWSNGSPSYGGPNNTDGGDERNGHFFTNLTITDPVSDQTHGVPRTASETRPQNAYVYYIIKAA